jgi:hypothetical protein
MLRFDDVKITQCHEQIAIANDNKWRPVEPEDSIHTTFSSPESWGVIKVKKASPETPCQICDKRKPPSTGEKAIKKQPYSPPQ